jgi:NitT/TauT family transport system ATP-binding protein
MTTKISFRDVVKTYPMKDGTFTALDHVSLDIADREFVTVVGPSGCGKSTLMSMAAGLVEPTAGEVLVDGVPVPGPGPDRGVIFQQYALFPWLTVRKNVEFGLKLMELPADERRRRAERAIALVGLSDFADALPKTLSGGMKQRCAIARAYAVDPQVLLMDEPFGALDALTRVQLQDQLLDTWSQEQRTVMFITHGRRPPTVVFSGPMFGGPAADTMWLRMSYHFDAENNEVEVRAATSRDGSKWVWNGVWTLPAKDKLKIGLVLMNRAGAVAKFDYVRTYRD